MRDRYPTEDEFWRRLEARGVEPDLVATLRARAAATEGTVTRLGDSATVTAVVERMLPRSAVPAPVIAAFLDAHFTEPMGRADEPAGVMPRAELFPAGFRLLDAAAGMPFAQASLDMQDDLLRRAEAGELQGPAGFNASVWFKRLRDLILLGFGSDPRGMVQMGYPGPSYRHGHVWLAADEVEGRAKRRPGYLSL